MPKGTDALWTLFTGGVGCGNDRPGRGPARAHDDTGAVVLHIGFLEAGIGDRLLHSDPVPGGAIAHEAANPAIDRAVKIELRSAMDLAAESEARVVVGLHDAGFRLTQRGKHLLAVVADARNNTDAGDDHTPHLQLPC
jgi:hypothetical protein